MINKKINKISEIVDTNCFVKNKKLNKKKRDKNLNLIFQKYNFLYLLKCCKIKPTKPSNIKESINKYVSQSLFKINKTNVTDAIILSCFERFKS